MFVTANGARIAGRIAVAAPVVREQDCACDVVIEGLDESYTIYGESTLQALLLAVQFLGSRLHDYQSRGVRFEADDPDGDPEDNARHDIITLLFGSLLRAAEVPPTGDAE